MRRSPLTRAAATLLSLLFLLAWGEPVALHPCPMHDGHPAAAVGHAGGPDASAPVAAAPAARDGHGGPSNHAAHLDAATPAPGAPSQDDAAHVCVCLGHCCSAAGVVLAPAQAIRWQVVVTRRAEPPAPEAATLARVATPHAIPFANGPPRLA